MMFEEVSLSEMYFLEYTTVQLVPIAPSFDLQMKIYLLQYKKSKQIPLFIAMSCYLIMTQAGLYMFV